MSRSSDTTVVQNTTSMGRGRELKVNRYVRGVHVTPLFSSSSAPVAPEETPVPRKLDEIVEQRVTLETERVRRECRVEAERLGEERYKKGWVEGKAVGQNEIQPALEHLSRLLEDMTDQRGRILKDAEKIAVQLGLKIAEKIIRTEVHLHPDLVLNVVGDAVRRVADKSSIVIRVNSDDVDRVSGYRERLVSLVGGIDTVEIRPDPSVTQGGCVVETSVEIIDAQFEQQLARLEEALIGTE